MAHGILVRDEGDTRQRIRRWIWRQLQIDRILMRCVRQELEITARLTHLESRLAVLTTTLHDTATARWDDVPQRAVDRVPLPALAHPDASGEHRGPQAEE